MANPYTNNPFTNLLDPEERLKQEMMNQQQGPVMMQNVPDQGQGPTMMQGVPNQGAIQGQLTGQQQTQIDDVSSQPIRGMKAIMSADTPTWGTALAKTVAAGLTGHYGRKEQKKEKERLTKALQTDANKTETERVEDLAKEQRKAGLEERRMLAYEAQIEAQTNPEITPYQQGQLDLKADYYDYLKTKSENTARKPLTENQMAIRTEKLESKLDPLQSVVGAMTEVDNLLAPYAEGGAKAGGDIPGLGFIEGQRGLVGDLYRMTLGSEDARNIQAAMAELTSERIRERAGLTQTLTETQSVLRGMAQQDFSDEKTALRAYGRVRAAYGRDMIRLRNGTHPDVLAGFEARYDDAGQASPFATTFGELNFPQISDDVAEETEEMEEVMDSGDMKPGHIPQEVWDRATAQQKAALGGL